MSQNQEDTGVPASPSGLRPFGAEPAAQSQAEPLVPNADTSRFQIEMNSVSVVVRARIDTRAALDRVVAILQANRELLPEALQMICAKCGEAAVKTGENTWGYNCDCNIYTAEDAASAIEARSGETGTGSTAEGGESAVAEGETPNPSSPPS